MNLLLKLIYKTKNRFVRQCIIAGYQVRWWSFVFLIMPPLLIGLYAFFSVVVCSTYSIPSSSMEPTVIPGDQVLVNKLILGGRLINYLDEDTILRVTGRLWGLRNPQRNDVLVFNYPHEDNWKKMVFNGKIFYMKRCVGLPGDTLSIENGIYKVKGYEGSLGLVEEQRKQLSISPDALREYGMYETIPYDSILNWNIRKFGPLYIPKRGKTICMDRDNYVLYRMYMEYETCKSAKWNGHQVLLNDRPITQYTFRESYYFMAGDNCSNSLDSRFFGMIPEAFIAGKAVMVWFSKPKGENTKIKWQRIGKEL